MKTNALDQVEPLMNQVLDICTENGICFMAFFALPDKSGFEAWRSAPEGVEAPEKMLIANGLMVGAVEIRSMVTADELKERFVN